MGVADLARKALRRVAWSVRKAEVERRIAEVQPIPADHTGGVILFFTPEAGVRGHLAAQCVIARTMQELGHRVLFVRCFELFPRCPVMDMYQLPAPVSAAEMHDTCLRCGGASLDMLGAYGFEHVDLRLLATPQMRARAHDAVANAPADLRDFTFDGIPFGRISIMDVVLATKVSEFDDVGETTRVAWLQYIESGLLSYLIMDRLLRSLTIRRIVHYEDYTLLLGARFAAARRNVPSVTLAHAGHRNIDRRRYVLSSYAGASLDMASIRAWPSWRELALSDEQVREVAEDLFTRLRGGGSHQFSPPKTFHRADIRGDLQLAKDRKLVVAYTSSLDEMLAEDIRLDAHGLSRPVHEETFADQVEWLEALIALAEPSDDIQLVVRVHPREGAGLRVGTSQHLARLRERFERDYANCRFIWPADPTSSLDLAEAADLALICWSTIGVELARLGVPVLAASLGIGPYPHDDFIEWRSDRADYLAKVRAMLGQPAQLDTIGRAFRWYHLAQLGQSLDLGDVIPSTDFMKLPRFQLPREAETIERAVLGETDIMPLNRERQAAAQGDSSRDDERRALARELRGIVHLLCTGQRTTRDVPLVVNPPETGVSSGVRTISIDGGTVHYRSDGRTHVKYSPMCARLAPLSAS